MLPPFYSLFNRSEWLSPANTQQEGNKAQSPRKEYQRICEHMLKPL